MFEKIKDTIIRPKTDEELRVIKITDLSAKVIEFISTTNATLDDALLLPDYLKQGLMQLKLSTNDIERCRVIETHLNAKLLKTVLDEKADEGSKSQVQ